VPGALHTGAIGAEPAEFRRRVIKFFDSERLKPSEPARPRLASLTEPPHRFAHAYGKSGDGFQSLEVAV
jgi:hypothetical protein